MSNSTFKPQKQVFEQETGGKDIKPPLIPSNNDKVYSSQGIYNIRGFYQDLNARILQQRQIIKRIQQNSQKSLNMTNNASFITASMI